VLARKYDERNEDVKKAFEKTPYLNSSLFSPTDIEQDTLFISNLKDDKTIPIFSQTVLNLETQGYMYSTTLVIGRRKILVSSFAPTTGPGDLPVCRIAF
jgi:hypothetical protein